ncbi:ATP-binding protein [Phycicoccus sp. Soil803]|uniref:ATP-binding protein n=1 Tax=Phycicoccus sp. Soil803 TaxID=1736415 RepID=UPI00138EFD47
MSQSPLWTRQATWAGTPRNVGHARAFVTKHLIHNGLSSEVDVLRLVVSELATNAVIHAVTPFTVTVGRINGTLSLIVRDRSMIGPEADPVCRPGLATGGRGLHLVELLSSTWGITLARDGKSVWARFVLADGPDRWLSAPGQPRPYGLDTSSTPARELSPPDPL